MAEPFEGIFRVIFAHFWVETYKNARLGKWPKRIIPLNSYELT